MSYRPEPRDFSGHVARFRARLSATMGGNLRVMWNPRAGKTGFPGRWQIQEKGHRSGRWSHVWFIQGPLGEYRNVGEWAIGCIHAMDMQLVGSGPAGWERFQNANKDMRRARAIERARKWADQLQYELMPKAAHFAERRGLFVPRTELPFEAMHKTAPKGRGDEDMFAMEALEGRGKIVIAAPRVFSVKHPTK